VRLRTPEELRQAFEHEGEADGRHEERDLRLVDERPQHDALGGDAERDHDGEGDEQRKPEVPAALDQRHVGERGEEHHRALREVEHARGLVDEDEAERDERVHHPGEQAADQHFDEEDDLDIH
jgi:hypothetical protein